MSNINDPDIEKLLRTYYPEIRKESIEKAKGSCLTDVVLARFFDNALTNEALKEFSDHVICCDRCAELVKDHLAIINAPEMELCPEVPPHVTGRVQVLFREAIKENFLTILLKVTDKALDLLETTGEILIGEKLMPLRVLRSRGKEEGLESSVKIVKTFKTITARVEIEKELKKSTRVTVRITEKEKTKKESLFRVSFFENSIEIHSILTEANQATFEEVSAGDYEIVIIKEGTTLGRIRLTVTS